MHKYDFSDFNIYLELQQKILLFQINRIWDENRSTQNRGRFNNSSTYEYRLKSVEYNCVNCCPFRLKNTEHNYYDKSN